MGILLFYGQVDGKKIGGPVPGWHVSFQFYFINSFPGSDIYTTDDSLETDFLFFRWYLSSWSLGPPGL